MGYWRSRYIFPREETCRVGNEAPESSCQPSAGLALRKGLRFREAGCRIVLKRTQDGSVDYDSDYSTDPFASPPPFGKSNLGQLPVMSDVRWPKLLKGGRKGALRARRALGP